MNTNQSAESPWYERWFDREEYELVYRDRNEAEGAQLIDLIESVVKPASDASVLDVACGRGRHARQLARRGYRVTGFDLSERALQTARTRAAEEELEIEFLQGDMREMSFAEEFDGAVNLFTSFGYFESDDEHERVICNIARALKPGGWFVQDFLNAPHVRETLVPEDERSENGVHIEQKRWISDGRLIKEITLRNSDGERSFTESVRLLTRDDFRSMYTAANLDIFDIRGDYDGQPYNDNSPRLILFARKT